MAPRSPGRRRYQWGLLLVVAALLVAWVLVDGTGQQSDRSATSGASTSSRG